VKARLWRAVRPYLLVPTGGSASTFVVALNWLLALLLLAALFTFSFQQLLYHWNWGAVYRYRAKLIQGWTVTVLISLVSLGVSTMLGVAIALARRSRFLLLARSERNQ